MKKIFILLLLATAIKSNACDVCGCGTGYFNPHLFPHLSKNYIHFGYQHRYYQTQFKENGHMHRNKEYYNSFLVFAQYNPFEKLQLQVIVPWQLNKQDGNHGKFSNSGIGDITLLANYKLFDHASSNAQHTLQVGSGIKLPTGNYEFDSTDHSQIDNYHFQLGTGSTDFLLNASYYLVHKNFIFSNGITYKINTRNKHDYLFGNRLLNVTQVKRRQTLGKFVVTPGVGLLYENLQKDKGDKNNFTGGYAMHGLVGLDINKEKWAIGFSYSLPIKQNLAAGQIKAMPGVNVNLSYSF